MYRALRIAGTLYMIISSLSFTHSGSRSLPITINYANEGDAYAPNRWQELSPERRHGEHWVAQTPGSKLDRGYIRNTDGVSRRLRATRTCHRRNLC